MDIFCLKAKTTRQQALALLRQSWRESRYGRLRLVMDFYVPFRLFRLWLDDGKQKKELLMAIDSFIGGLDPYLFPEAPGPHELALIKTVRSVPSLVNEKHTFTLLEERLKREAFRKGFFKLGELKVGGQEIANFHLPYWVGVFERNEQAHLEVIDALRGRLEGAKLREIVTDWLKKSGQKNDDESI